MKPTADLLFSLFSMHLTEQAAAERFPLARSGLTGEALRTARHISRCWKSEEWLVTDLFLVYSQSSSKTGTL